MVAPTYYYPVKPRTSIFMKGSVYRRVGETSLVKIARHWPGNPQRIFFEAMEGVVHEPSEFWIPCGRGRIFSHDADTFGKKFELAGHGSEHTVYYLKRNDGKYYSANYWEDDYNCAKLYAYASAAQTSAVIMEHTLRGLPVSVWSHDIVSDKHEICPLDNREVLFKSIDLCNRFKLNRRAVVKFLIDEKMDSLCIAKISNFPILEKRLITPVKILPGMAIYSNMDDLIAAKMAGETVEIYMAD